MTDQFIGEIRIFAGTFDPQGWEFCDGVPRLIADFPDLYTLIGSEFGGDGITTFATPDLRGRAPMHAGNDFVLGESGGAEQVTLTTVQLPVHSHPYTAATNPASVASPSGTLNAESSQINMFIADDPGVALAPNALSPIGGSQPHDNMQPFLAMNFIIASAVDPTPDLAPLVGELRLFPQGPNIPPLGWAFCNGQILPISQNTALFSLLGTFYGGDGKSTFALPNLEGSIPIGDGQGPGLSERFIGEASGVESVTLLDSEAPVHTHTVRASQDFGDIATPQPGESLAKAVGGQSYQTNSAANIVSMAPQVIPVAGGDLPHTNMMPYLTLQWCIALQGEFPVRK
jgi:microcystin-dependent protein